MTRTPRQIDALAWRAADELGDGWEVTRRENTAPARNEWVVYFRERSQEGVTTATAMATVSVDEVAVMSDDEVVAWILDCVRSHMVAGLGRANVESTT